MKLKYIVTIFLLSLLITSCNQENEPIQPDDNIEDCLVDEFYARMLINGKCWTSSFAYFGIQDSVIGIRMRKENKFEEEFSFRINTRQFNLNTAYYPIGNRNSSFYLFITEGIDALVTYFEPRYSIEKDLNWVIEL